MPVEESDTHFLTQYQQFCITRESDGPNSVQFPWKEDHPPLTTNYQICKNITRSLVRRLGQNQELLHFYGKIIFEQEQKDFIEKVADQAAPTAMFTLDPESKLITYCFKTVLLGSNSSPFMLNATL